MSMIILMINDLIKIKNIMIFIITIIIGNVLAVVDKKMM